MISAAQVVSAMQQTAEPTCTAAGSSRDTAPNGTQQPRQLHDELRSAALRMRLEMPLKERTIHLQTFKYTFTGQQAVTFLQQHGLANNQDVAVDLCQRMLSQGLFKSTYHREVFLPDGEVYRFSSSFPDGHKQKGRIPGSITSTGLYKEIAKIGKTAAQPFKNIQLSLNDTFNSLGSLSMPAAAKPGQLGGSLGGSRPRSSGSGAGRALPRRSQTGKLHHMYSDSSHGLQDSTSGLGALAGSMDALQASIKESTSLLRLDLQQHTALQEHLLSILMAQQDSICVIQLLIALNAFAVLLLLAFSSSWTATVAAGCTMAVLLCVLGPEAVARFRQPAAGAAGLATVRGAEQPLLRASRVLGTSAGGTETAAGLGEFAPVHDRCDGERDSDQAEDLEDLIPLSEDFDEWPDAPVMLCADPAAAHQSFGVEGPGPCPGLSVNGDPIPFESELFKGVVAVYVRHLPTTPTHLFKGKKRLTWVALQGTFKRPVLMEDLVYGMEFSRQLSNLPAPWFLENMLLPLARKISPSLRVGTLEDPYFFSPIITASQVVNVSLPGQAPQLMDATEDIRLLQQELAGKAGDGLTVASRRRYFQAAVNRHMPFSTEYVWTFHLWQEYIDYASYMLSLGYSSYDLTQHLDGQPLQVMAKDGSTGQQLISLHVWHANLVRSLARSMPRRPRASRVSNVSLDGLHNRSEPVTAGGVTDTDTALASPTSTAQQTPELLLTPRTTQQQQQQQHGTFSSPLPVLDFSTPQQQNQQQEQEQQQQQQQQEHYEDALDEQQELQQELPLQLPHQQQQLVLQQQAVIQLQQQQEQLVQSQGSRRCGASAQPQLQQGPSPSSHSDSKLQRPANLRRFRESEGSMSDPDQACGSILASLPQLSALRPAAKTAGPAMGRGSGLQQQLSLPAQHQLQGDLSPSLGEPQGSNAASSSGGAAGASPSGTPVLACASGLPESWCAPGRSVNDARAGRLSSGSAVGAAGEDISVEGVDSPLAGRTPGRLSSSNSGSAAAAAAVAPGGVAAMLKAQPHLQRSASGKKTRKEQRDKEEQQRHQLHGLSVMGAL